MPATHSSFSYTPVAGLAIEGMLYDMSDVDVISRIYEPSSPAGVYAGKGVVQGTDPVKQCVMPSTAITGTFLGFVVYEAGKAKRASGYSYDRYESVPILRRGRIWLMAEGAIAAGTKPYIRHTANGALLPGNIRGDADTAKADQLEGVLTETATSGAGLILVSVNLPA